MRTFLSGVFVLLGVVLMPFSGFAAGLTTDHWSIDVSETEDLRLNFAVEYLGDAETNAPSEASALEETAAAAPSTAEASAPAESATSVSAAATVDETTATEEAALNASAATEPATVIAVNPPPTNTVSTIIPIGPGDILINEFVSDPVSGASEWVELYNTLPVALELDDWSLEDAAGSSIAVNGALDAHGYLLVSFSRSLLNNGGDVITLLNPEGVAIDQLSYGEVEVSAALHGPAVQDPSSVGRSPEDPMLIMEMTPTPGALNVLPIVEAASTQNTSSATDEPVASANDTVASTVAGEATASQITNEPNYDFAANDDSSDCESATASAPVDDEAGTPEQVVPIANIRAFDLGTRVITEGVISAAPGVLGKQVFYLAGSGIQVYLHSAEFGELVRGMRVRVAGELSSSAGEARIKLGDASDITRLGQADAPLPHDIALDEVGEATEGWLVRVTGTVASKEGASYFLSDGAHEAKMYIKDSTGIVPSFSVGDELTVVGIVSETSAGYRILPRDNDDILVRTPQNEEEQEVIPAGFISSRQTPTKLIGWSLAGAATAVVAAFAVAHSLKHKRLAATTA